MFFNFRGLNSGVEASSFPVVVESFGVFSLLVSGLWIAGGSGLSLSMDSRGLREGCLSHLGLNLVGLSILHAIYNFRA